MAQTNEQRALPTQKEVQAEYEAAKAAGVSACTWIPPEWKGVKTAADNLTRVLPNNSRDDDGFENQKGASDEALERIREGNDMQVPDSPESPPKLGSWTNPFSDFTHIDESEFPSAAIDELEKPLFQPLFQEVEAVDPGLGKKLRATLGGPNRDLLNKINKALKGTHAGLRKKVRDALQERVGSNQARSALISEVEGALTTDAALRGEVTKEIENAPPARTQLDTDVDTVLKDPKHEKLKKKVKDALAGDDPVGRLKRIVGPGSPGMKRLGLIFEWALHRTTVLMGDINAALDWGPNERGQNEPEAQWKARVEPEWSQRYVRARENYIRFLRDLDDHEPEKKRAKLDGTKKDKDKPSGYGRSLKWACIDPVIFGGRIVGARVIIHWNPHSSSNGIPVQHP